LIGKVDIPTPFGAITLDSDNTDPTPIWNRGWYFDGENDKVGITGVVINSSFTLITWLKYQREATLGKNPIFSLDTELNLPFGAFFESSAGLLGKLNLELTVEWDQVSVTWNDVDIDFFNDW
jgi:hypothetical protein